MLLLPLGSLGSSPAELHAPKATEGLNPFGTEIDRYRTAGSVKFGKYRVTRNPHLSRGARRRSSQARGERGKRGGQLDDDV
jgi:hypothetical protein